MTAETCEITAWLRQKPGGDPIDDDAIVAVGTQMEVDPDDGSGWLHVLANTIDGKRRAGFVDARCILAPPKPDPPPPQTQADVDPTRPVANPGAYWVFVQRTGKMFHVVNGAAALLAIGYSGNGASENNPDDQCVVVHGPLPRGRYSIGAPVQFKAMQFCLPLTPDRANEMCGRADFLIHDGNFALNAQGVASHGMTSEGCICLQQQWRVDIWSSGHHVLKVVKDDSDVLTFGHIKTANVSVVDDHGAVLGTLSLNAVVDVVCDDGAGKLFVTEEVGGTGLAGFVDAAAVTINSGPTAPATPNAAPPPLVPVGGGFKFTTNPNEVATTTTTPKISEVIPALMANWAALNEIGARILCSQFMLETADGKYCFNWNLGNVKSPSDTAPHMYLRNVWECENAADASTAIANGAGLAHLATPDEIKAHGWNCAQTIVVFSPPHAQCRFRAYASLTDGAAQWCSKFVRLATQNPAIVTQLTGGDIAGFTRSLKLASYFSADEAAYRVGLMRKKASIDAALAA